MNYQVQEFQAPKNGSRMEECQDAVRSDMENGIYAIADGVSDSAFQQRWARLLVDSFVENARTVDAFTPEWVADWLGKQQQKWQSQLDPGAMPWHGRMKAAQIGGEATFLGIRLDPDRRSWTGIVIGDCNLFRFDRNRGFVQSMPFRRSDEFSNNTQAFSSINKDYSQIRNQVKVIRGSIQPGDYLMLATDAMARWILQRLEEKKNPLLEIPRTDDPVTFQHWVAAQRQSQKIKDDDTSLLVIQVEPQKAAIQEKIPADRTTEPGWGSQPYTPTGEFPRRVWISLVLASMTVCTVFGFLLGSRVQRSRMYSTLEPLVALANSPQLSRDTLKKELYQIIIAIEPKTGKNLICQVDQGAAICKAEPSPEPSPKPSPQPGG